MSVHLGRRDFLCYLSGFFATFLPGALSGCSLSSEPRDRKKAGQILSSFFSDGDKAAQVGRTYALASKEFDKEIIVESLCETVPEGCAGLVKAAPEEQRRIITQRIARDYEEGNIVEVGGWLLSRTEARLCALAVTG